uniref:Nucleoprotein n=1 Tax=Solenopsis invicta virus 14 TaxID=2810810 RepID=A0A891H5J2_9VIRU
MAESLQLTYETFTKAVGEYITQNEAIIISKISGYAYQGFTPKEVFKALIAKMRAASLSQADANKDIADMISIFLIRGPNMAKVKMDTVTGGQQSFDRISELIRRYDIKSRAPSPTDITLPRISMIFASISWLIYKACAEHITSYPVSSAEIGLDNSQIFSFNFVPCLLRSTDLAAQPDIGCIMMTHNIYQAYLTKKTTLRNAKDAQKYIPSATKYAYLACKGTLMSSTAVVAHQHRLKEFVTPDLKKQFVSLMKSFFKILPDENCEEITTCHYIVNFCRIRNISIGDIGDDIFFSDLAAAKSFLES